MYTDRQTSYDQYIRIKLLYSKYPVNTFKFDDHIGVSKDDPKWFYPDTNVVRLLKTTSPDIL